MSSRPFDLQKLDYESTRRHRRRELLLWSIGPSVLVLMVALWFIVPVVSSHVAVGAYKKGHYSSAHRWLVLLPISSPQPFVAHFDLGTADTALEQYDKSEAELTIALGLAKDTQRCMVAKNLVFTLEQHAQSAGSAAKNTNIYATKVAKVKKAYPKCFKIGAQGGSSGGGSSASSTTSLSDAEQQQLQQKEEQGRERQAQFAREETFNASDPNVKRW